MPDGTQQAFLAWSRLMRTLHRTSVHTLPQVRHAEARIRRAAHLRPRASSRLRNYPH